MTIFGISIGTSRTGICILQDGKLVYAHVHDYPTPWTDTKLRIILNQYRQYFHLYQITDVMIKIPHPSRRTKHIHQLIRRIEAMIKEYYCSHDLTTKTEIKEVFALRSSEEIPDFATRLYPKLSGLYDKGKTSNHRFYRKLYEAVLAAYMYQERIRIRKLKIENTNE
jgi:hypothetical protein